MTTIRRRRSPGADPVSTLRNLAAQGSADHNTRRIHHFRKRNLEPAGLGEITHTTTALTLSPTWCWWEWPGLWTEAAMTPEQRRKMDLTLARFVDSMTAWNRSRKTIISYEQNLRYFINWLHTETDVATLAEVSPDTLASYQMELLSMEKANGELLAVGTQKQRITAVKSVFRHLAEERKLLS